MEKTTFKSIFDAIASTKEEAQKMKLRANLMTDLIATIESWNLTQKLAAEKLGIMQPRLNTLLKGKMSDFSLDSLVDLSLKAGLSIHLEISKAA